MTQQYVADSDYKFLLDVRKYMEEKVGALEFPEELLKRIMKANNPDKDEAFVNDNFDKSIEELKWHLIKEQLVKANEIKVTDDDVKAAAIEATRFQFAQYGMNNIPDEYLEQYAAEMMKKTGALKNVVKLNHKSVTAEDFGKLFE